MEVGVRRVGKAAVGIELQREDPVVGQRTGRTVGAPGIEASARGVEALQPAADAAGPDRAVGVLGQRTDRRPRALARGTAVVDDAVYDQPIADEVFSQRNLQRR